MLATALGLALILQPDKARPMLINFMGVFWLAAGIVSLRWGHPASGRGAAVLEQHALLAACRFQSQTARTVGPACSDAAQQLQILV